MLPHYLNRGNTMTINEAINKIDALKPNGYSHEDKTRWLSSVDGVIKAEIIDTHEGGEDIVFEEYTGDTDPDTNLLVSAPYDDLYLRWLEARIDYANGEYSKFNNSITMYNAELSAFSNYYNRTHMPKGKKRKYFG